MKIEDAIKEYTFSLATSEGKAKNTVSSYSIDLKHYLNFLKSKDIKIKFGIDVSDRSYGMFLNFLSYKLDWLGKKLIKVDRYFPSSKLCNKCGYKNDKLQLSDRDWICPICGEKHDRDKNAAINIRNEGIRLVLQNQ